MASYKVSLIILVTITTLSTLTLMPCAAQNAVQDYVNAHNTPRVPCAAQNAVQDYVNAHNTPRGQVGVGSVSWNTTLVTYAQNYANQRKGDCALTHSSGPYGENLAKGSSSSFSGAAAVNLWVAEKQYYDHTSNSCIGGNQCLHYTQVVWHDSTQIGCARVQCNNGWYYVVCSYCQPGNWVGESPY